MDIKALQEKQNELDAELTKCPKCGKETTWGEIREIGECLKCYYKYYAKRKNFSKVETNKFKKI